MNRPQARPAGLAVIYQCPECETRYLGDRRCPHCDELVTTTTTGVMPMT